MISFKDFCVLSEARKGNPYDYEKDSGAKGLAHKVGDSAWAKHPTEKYKTLAGKVTKIGRTLTTLQHKDGTVATYPHADVSPNFEKLNPKGKNESVELDEAEGLTTKKNQNGGHDVYHNGTHIGHVEQKSMPWLRGKTIKKVFAKKPNGDSVVVDSDDSGKNTIESAKKTLLRHHMKNESYDYDSWHHETMKKHLDQYHSHLSPEKHKEISQHFAKKKKVDLIGSQDELGIPVGSVKTIWNHLKDARKSSFGSTHDSESKGTKLNRALGQQKAGMIRK